METATFSLILGCLGAGLIWRLTQGLVRRWSAKAPVPGGAERESDAPWEQSRDVYRTLLCIRLASIVLCALAAAALLLERGTAPALALAGLGCCLHYAAYRIRTRHVQAVQKAALLTPGDAPAEPFRADARRPDEDGSSVRPARTA